MTYFWLERVRSGSLPLASVVGGSEEEETADSPEAHLESQPPPSQSTADATCLTSWLGW